MITRMGGFCASMVRICTGEVVGAQQQPEPSGLGLK